MGIAPEGARFLLVKTNFLDTDREAASWAFSKAKNRPCVINMSFGAPLQGAHDGSDVEERLHEALVGPGKLIVISAGNERHDAIHIGGLFFPTRNLRRFPSTCCGPPIRRRGRRQR